MADPDFDKMDIDRESHLSMISKKCAENEQLVQHLQDLHAGCIEISAFASEYDYNAETRANGFRCFLQMICFYFANMAALMPNGEPTAKNDSKLLREYKSLAPVFMKQLEILRLVRAKDANGPHDRAIITDHDIEIIEKLLQFDATDIKPFYSRVGPFYLRSDLQAVSQKMSRVFSIAFAPPGKMVKIMFSRSKRADYQTKISLNQNLHTMRRTIEKLKQFPFKQVLRVLATKDNDTSSQYVCIPKQSEWKITLPDVLSKARIERSIPSETQVNHSDTGVTCLIIRKGTTRTSPNSSLIFHVPGGGFIMVGPDFHERYLKTWVKETGVPVLCPDYSKAPEKPYPAALQDILDVYLFMTSGDPKVEEILGFHPNNIVMSGDSSGGNLSPSATFVLNEIRKLAPEAKIQMPKGLVLQYPAANPSFVVDSSATLTNFDTALPAATCLTCFSLYVSVEPKIDDYLWFRKEGVSEVIKRFRHRVQDPFVNLLAYDKFEELKDIPLCLSLSEFDPVLDQAIDLAKKWKGKTTVDIARRLQHGFLAFAVVGSAMQDCHLVVQRIKETLELEA